MGGKKDMEAVLIGAACVVLTVTTIIWVIKNVDRVEERIDGIQQVVATKTEVNVMIDGLRKEFKRDIGTAALKLEALEIQDANLSGAVERLRKNAEFLEAKVLHLSARPVTMNVVFDKPVKLKHTYANPPGQGVGAMIPNKRPAVSQ